MKTKWIVIAVVFVLACGSASFAQDNTSMWPNVLWIEREEIKPGKSTSHNEQVKRLRQVSMENPKLAYIAATSMSGSTNEEFFFSAANSFAELGDNMEAFEKSTASFRDAAWNQQVGDVHGNQRAMFVTLDKSLSLNLEKFDPAKAKYWTINIIRMKPGSQGPFSDIRKELNGMLSKGNYKVTQAVYVSRFGSNTPTWVIFRGLESLAELDVDYGPDFRAVVPDTYFRRYMQLVSDTLLTNESILVAVRPELSAPAKAFAERNTAFWTVKEEAPVVADAKKKSKAVQTSAKQ